MARIYCIAIPRIFLRLQTRFGGIWGRILEYTVAWFPANTIGLLV